MPVLDNSRRERFAQALARGLYQADAYAEAGYIRSTAAAARLANRASIQARVAEIRDGVAARTEIDVAMVTQNLIRIAGKAEAFGGAPGLGVARSAWMDAAKLNRLMSDKGEVGGEKAAVVLSSRPMSEEEWLATYGVGGADDGEPG
jgi:hypothetical protein